MKSIHKSFTWLVVACLLIAAGMAFTFWAYKQIEITSDQRKQTRLIIGKANDFLSALIDAEAGQQGYTLTGDEAYMQPSLAVREHLGEDLNVLRQLSGSGQAQRHLAAIAPLLDAKLALLAKVIALRRNHEAAAAMAVISSGEGKHLMDAIRIEIKAFDKIQEEAMRQYDILFDANMRRLFTIMLCFGLLALLFALYFSWSRHRATQQKLKALVHLETRHLLDVQTDTNNILRQTNRSLQDSEQKLSVTLHSIGDAVIATDGATCVTLLNSVAEDLTGWTFAQAIGRPVAEIFHIVNRDTRQPTAIPVVDTLARGTIQGMANHTVLIARDGREFDIADSCAPIRDNNGLVVGAVLVFRNVTEEYKVQQALQDSAALVQTILDTVIDGIVTINARGGIVESVNPAIELMFGYTATELSGKRFGLLIPELDQDQHDASLAFYSASREASALGMARQVTGHRKDGGTFPLEINASEMKLGGQRYFTGVLRDITARKAAEDALHQANALQNAIFNSANFSSIATDANGVIQIFNVGAERMLGYAAADVVNKTTPADISDPLEIITRAASLSQELETKIAPGFDALVFKASRGIEDIYELTYVRKDGSRLPAMVSVTALLGEDKAIIGYLLIGTDNTARKRVDAERSRLDQVLQDKNVELEIARSSAEKANLAKSDFLSSMSHELRSPLNAILGFAQLMDSGTPGPSPAQKSSIEQILRAGWYLLELINEILDLALIESGKLSMSLEPISLPEVLLDCQTMIEPQAQGKGIHMRFPHFDAPCFVHADRTRVKQVLLNLLSNAIKYNRANGSVEVSFSQDEAKRLRVVVRDTGEGLSPLKLTQLFQPFNRLGQEASLEEGTGIGLVVSKRLVELMGGSIGAQSTVGTGSAFWIELNHTDPVQLVVDTSDVTFLQSPVALEGAEIRTVLYVEDNQANMDLVEELIGRRPELRLLKARDGMRGIALARTHLPDVILMDINLPGISGIQALNILRDDPSTRHIPVLALSANAMQRDIEKGMQAGFFRYLTKPIKLAEFMQALNSGLELAQATRT